MAVNNSNSPKRFIKLPKVRELTTLSTTEIYRRLNDDRFPRQIALGSKSVVWLESEILEWMDQQISESAEA